MIIKTLFTAAVFLLAAANVHAFDDDNKKLGASPDTQYQHFDSPKDIPIRLFTQPNNLSRASLSPDGKHLLLVSNINGNAVIKVHDVDAEDPHQSHLSDKLSLNDFAGVYWVSNDRIMLQVVAWRLDRKWNWVPHVRLIAVNVNGSNAEAIYSISYKKQEIDVDNLVLDTLPNDPDNILIATNEDGKSIPHIYKLDIYTGETSKVMEGRKGINYWLTDEDGTPRLGVGTGKNDKLSMIARVKASDEWLELADNEIFEDGRFTPLHLSTDGHTMLVRSAISNGRFAIYRFDMVTGKLIEKIYENPDVDVRQVELSAKSQKLLAINYIDDNLERKYFDKAYENTMKSIERALPNRSNYVLNRSSDDRYMLIYSLSDRFPGALYRMDTKTKRMNALMQVNREINPTLMSPTTRMNYFARDGLEIPAYMTIPLNVEAKNLPTIILPHGGPQTRSDAEFDSTVQLLASRGYMVIQPNYRGSTGYSFEFQTLGYGEWGNAMQNDLEDAVDYFVDEGLVDENRVCIIGQSSYSSFAALLGVMKSPERFACAVAIAPRTDLKKYVSARKKRYGSRSAYRIVGKKLTKTIKKNSPISLVPQLKKPTLLYHSELDPVISNKDFQKFEKALQKAKAPYELVKLEDKSGKDVAKEQGDHGLRKAKERLKFWRKMEKFLVTHLGEGTVAAIAHPTEKTAQKPTIQTDNTTPTAEPAS